jgi:hypothetical protein
VVFVKAFKDEIKFLFVIAVLKVTNGLRDC